MKDINVSMRNCRITARSRWKKGESRRVSCRVRAWASRWVDRLCFSLRMCVRKAWLTAPENYREYVHTPYNLRTCNVSVSHFLNDEEVHKASLPQSFDLERAHLACAMLIRSLTLLAALASSAIADVEFVTPAAGSTVVGAKTLSVTWKESGVKPPITSFTTFTIFLVAGGDEVESQVCIQPMKRECEQARPLLWMLIRNTSYRSKSPLVVRVRSALGTQPLE